MTYEQVSWNADHIKSLIDNGLSVDEFLQTSLLEGHYSQFSEDDRVEMLRDVYQRIASGDL